MLEYRHMETKKLTAAEVKELAREIFGPELEKFAVAITDRMQASVEQKNMERLTKALLNRRKKLAETEEVMAERGMTRAQIRLHNAYADGYNARTMQLRRTLLGVDESPATGEFEPIDPIPEPQPAEPEPIVEPTPELEVVPEPTPEEAPLLPGEEVIEPIHEPA